MIVTQLLGGLGNQLFQYAAGRALAQRQGMPLVLDLSRYIYDDSRAYRLDQFDITARAVSDRVMLRLGRKSRYRIPVRLYCRLRYGVPTTIRLIEEPWHQPDFAGSPLGAQRPGSVYLKGFWQSERHFMPERSPERNLAETPEIESILRRELTARAVPQGQNAELARRIADAAAVSLHVRRGDYVTNLGFHRRFGVCSLDYYHAAVALIAQRVPDPHFFLFSDNMGWVRENLRLEHPTTYVDHNSPGQDYEDLRLMTLCRHHIIANSTFSWWGAWLGAHPEKIVIAPRRWLATEANSPPDITPAGWLRL